LGEIEKSKLGYAREMDMFCETVNAIAAK